MRVRGLARLATRARFAPCVARARVRAYARTLCVRRGLGLSHVWLLTTD